MKQIRPRLTDLEFKQVERFRNTKGNVLIIGDIHAPFDLEKYFDFCIEQKERFNCTEFVFIGDVIDSHYSSYHEADPDGMSAKDELDLSVKRLKRWHTAFPNAYVTIGNHDRIVHRKAYSMGVSNRWIKDYKDVLEVPSWNFVNEVEINGVLYIHGEGGTARTRVKSEFQSMVQGHLHTQSYIEWTVTGSHRVFAMQTGCGIDWKSYAMAYARSSKKPVIGCAVVLDGGKTPISLTMDL
jgi:UDP-2,3-diacylglucosamine pyrophosphatase LpxH